MKNRKYDPNKIYEADTLEEAEIIAEAICREIDNLPSRYWEGEPVEDDSYPEEVANPYIDEEGMELEVPFA